MSARARATVSVCNVCRDSPMASASVSLEINRPPMQPTRLGYHFICITDPRKRFPHREKAFLAFLIQDLVTSTLKLVKRDHRENVERTAGDAWDLIGYDSNEVRLPQLPRGTRFHTLHTGWTVCIVPTRCKVQVHFSRDSATRTHKKHCLYVPE